jgi:nucleotide-binding universal stress UspA family protein
MMFDNVLVGVDGRPYGRDAMTLASRLKDPGARLTLAFVRSGSLAEDLEGSSKLLEQERSAANLQAELVGVPAASPGRGLHEQAERQHADLLVVGSCARSALGRAMLGDDTRAALNGAGCAVAIASHGFAQRSEPIAKVVAPAIGDTIDALLKEASARMQQLSGVEGRAAYGLTGEELAAFSDEVDLLVVGSRSYGPAKRLVLGSTSNYLERHARCSLLVLPRLASPGGDAADSQRFA